jgi:uncharacterized protein YcnI
LIEVNRWAPDYEHPCMGFPHVQSRRRPGRAARAMLVAFAAVGAVLAFAGPAAAQIIVTPDQAVQGDAARLTFRVTNEAQRTTITKVEVRLPADAPIAEVYPMSVSDWAPRQVTRKLDRPLPSLHGPAQDEVVSMITWIAAPGRGVRPGGTADLSLSVGPLPEVDRLVFQVLQTNSDGSVVRFTARPAAGAAPGERPAPAVALRPAVAGEVTAHGTQHGAGTGAQVGAPPAGEGGDSGRSNAWWLAGAMLLIGVIAGVGIARQRRPAPVESGSDPPPTSDAPKATDNAAVPAGLNGGSG